MAAIAMLNYSALGVETALAAPVPVMTGPFTGATQQTGRIFRDAVPSSCGAPKAYPGLFNAATTYNYETQNYIYDQPSGCVTFYFDPNSGASPCGTNAHLSVYDGSYDPNNQGANYLGDVGSSVTQPMSVNLTKGQAVVLVVTNTSGPATCDFTVSADFPSGTAGPGAVAQTRAIIRNFMNRRADVITTSGPSTTNFHSRFTGSLFGDDGSAPDAEEQTASMAQSSYYPANDLEEVSARVRAANGAQKAIETAFAAEEKPAGSATLMQAMGLNGNYENGSGRLSYGTGLHRMLSAYASRDGKGPVDPSEMPRFNVWSEGHMTFYRDNTGNAGQDGYGAILYAGADYLIHPAVLVGALVQVDFFNEESKRLNTMTKGTGWMAGPYVSARLTPHLYFDARAAWGTSSNRINPFGTYTDSFSTTRQLYSAKLTGFWKQGNWRFTPNAELVYFTERQSAYTDSAANFIPSQRIEVGRTIFGPEVGYRKDLEGGSKLDFTVGLKGIWDFAGDRTKLVGANIIKTQEFRGKLEAGIDYVALSGMTFNLMGFYDGIGVNGYDAYGARVGASIPF
ncbi:MAG: autotransporter outer membrane beta-barrel domain-containing protein [Notoacmeibacter sp.]|nr:autotransporter outer membrane beta-barrel domain-containing protein [Notoacmeibacter sp.]